MSFPFSLRLSSVMSCSYGNSKCHLQSALSDRKFSAGFAQEFPCRDQCTSAQPQECMCFALFVYGKASIPAWYSDTAYTADHSLVPGKCHPK